MTNAEVRDAFADIYRALDSGVISYKDAAQRNVALHGILTSARLELEALKLTMRKPDGPFWNAEAAGLTNEQLGKRIRAIAVEKS